MFQKFHKSLALLVGYCLEILFWQIVSYSTLWLFAIHECYLRVLRCKSMSNLDIYMIYFRQYRFVLCLESTVHQVCSFCQIVSYLLPWQIWRSFLTTKGLNIVERDVFIYWEFFWLYWTTIGEPLCLGFFDVLFFLILFIACCKFSGKMQIFLIFLTQGA